MGPTLKSRKKYQPFHTFGTYVTVPETSKTFAVDKAVCKDNYCSDCGKPKSFIPKWNPSLNKQKSKCSCQPILNSCDKTAKNCQRVQMVNISPDFANKSKHPESQSLSTAKPIPIAEPAYRQVNNECLNDWFMDSFEDYLHVPANSYASSCINQNERNEENNCNAQSVTNLATCDSHLNNEHKQNIANNDNSNKDFKTTHDNVQDWLDSDMQYPTKDIESGFCSMSPPELVPVEVDINTTIGYKEAANTPKSSQKTLKNSTFGEQNEMMKNTIISVGQSSVGAKHFGRCVSYDKMSKETNTDIVLVIGKGISKNFQFPSNPTFVSAVNSYHPHTPPHVPSYTDCPSEILQRTTNLETAGFSSRHFGSLVTTNLCVNEAAAVYADQSTATPVLSMSQNTDSIATIAATDLEVRGDFSQSTLEQMDLIDDQSECLRTSSKSQSLLTYDVRCSDPSIVYGNWDYKVDDKSFEERKDAGRYSCYYGMSRCDKNFKRTKHYHGRYVHCRRNKKHYLGYNQNYKRTQVHAMSFLQRTMIWEDVDVQTTMMHFSEVGTTTSKDQRSLAIATSLRLNSWLTTYNKLHSGYHKKSRSMHYDTDYISRGPSMFPLSASTKSMQQRKITNDIKSVKKTGVASTNTITTNIQSLPILDNISWTNKLSFNRFKMKLASNTQTNEFGHPYIRTFQSTPARPVACYQCGKQAESGPYKDNGTAMESFSLYSIVKAPPIIYDFNGTAAFAFFGSSPKTIDGSTNTSDSHEYACLHVRPLKTNFINNCTQCDCRCMNSQVTETPFMSSNDKHTEKPSGQITSNYDNLTGLYKPRGFFSSHSKVDASTTFGIPSTSRSTSRNIKSQSMKKSDVDVLISSSTKYLDKDNSATVPNNIEQKRNVNASGVSLKKTANTRVPYEETSKKERANFTNPEDHNLKMTDVKIISISSAVLSPKEARATSTKSDIYGFEESTSTEKFTTLPVFDIELRRAQSRATREVIRSTKSIGLTTSELKRILTNEKVLNCNTSMNTMDCQIQYSDGNLKSFNIRTSTSTNTEDIFTKHSTKSIQKSLSSDYKKETMSQSAQYVLIQEPEELPPKQSNGTSTRVVTISRGLSAIIVGRPRGCKNAHVQYSCFVTPEPLPRASAAVLTDSSSRKSVGEMTSSCQISSHIKPNIYSSVNKADASIQHSNYATQFSSQRSNKIGRSQLLSVFTLSESSCEAGTQITPTVEQETLTKIQDSPDNPKPTETLQSFEGGESMSLVALDENGESRPSVTFENLGTCDDQPLCSQEDSAKEMDPTEDIPTNDLNENDAQEDTTCAGEAKSPLLLPKALSSGVYLYSQRPHSSPRTPAFSLDSKLDEQVVCLSRLIGRGKWSSHKTESSSLNAAKWIRRCGFPLDNEISKDYQSLLNLEKTTSDYSIPNDRLSNVSNIMCGTNNLVQLTRTAPSQKIKKPNIIVDTGAEPMVSLSKDSLADVLPIQRPLIQSNSEGGNSRFFKKATLDKLTSDLIPPKELKESELQASPESHDAATNTAPSELKMHKSESVFTSRIILPPCHCKNKGNDVCPDCIFVYDRPRCLVHRKSLIDACIQRQPSNRDVELDARKEHAVDEYVGSATSMGSCMRSNSCDELHRSHNKPEVVISEVLSPRVYKALYETSKLIKRSIPRKYSVSSNNTDAAVATEFGTSSVSAQVYAPEKLSAAILTSRYCCEEMARKRQHTDSIPCRQTFEHKDSVSQYCTSCQAKMLDLTPANELLESACGSLEECMKSQLMGSCRYYSNLLTRHIGKVKETLTRQLSPERRDLERVVFKESKPETTVTSRHKPSDNASCYVTTALSGMDICGREKENLKMVYYTLSAIEGRIRRLRNNMPD